MEIVWPNVSRGLMYMIGLFAKLRTIVAALTDKPYIKTTFTRYTGAK